MLRTFTFVYFLVCFSSFAHESPFRSEFKIGRFCFDDRDMAYLDQEFKIFEENFEEYQDYKKKNPDCSCYTGEKVRQILRELNCSNENGPFEVFPKKELGSREAQYVIYPPFLGHIFGGGGYGFPDGFYYLYRTGYCFPDGEMYDTHENYLCSTQRVVYILFRYAFFYSHFRKSFLDLISRGEKEEYNTKINKMYLLLKYIQRRFVGILEHCIAHHPHPKPCYELGLIYYDQGRYPEATRMIEKTVQLAEKPEFEGSLSSEMYHMQGKVYVDVGLYDQALHTLNLALQKDPNNAAAHLERATCCLEKGEFDAALDDYNASQQSIKPIGDSRRLNKKDLLVFSTGLVAGLTEGGITATKEFVPSMLASARGIGNGIWAFACDPKEVSMDVIIATNELLSFIEKTGVSETALLLIPELKDLKQNWDCYNYKKRGLLIGTIIGRYGIDALAAAGTFKLAHHLSRLRRANSCQTMATMAKNAEKATVIKNVSKKWWSETKPIIKKLKKQDGRLDQNLAKAFRGQHLNELQVRKILHAVGFKTFPRPKGIPSNYLVRISDRNGGMIYLHPKHNSTSIRVMPGSQNSQHLSQRKPYVIHEKHGKRLDMNGNVVDPKSAEAHIPLDEYRFTE